MAPAPSWSTAARCTLACCSPSTAGRRIDDARLVLGGVASIPWRARAADQRLLGAEIGEELFARAAEIALAEAQPLRQNAYKLPLTRALVQRALASLAATTAD